MHDCPECGEACDCDGEDHGQSAPEDCGHDCEPEEELEGMDEEYLATGDAAYDEIICRGCGCSAFNPCPGGCVWATESLCSRCAGGS